MGTFNFQDIVNEQFGLITEGSRDNLLQAYLEKVNACGQNLSLSQFKQLMLNKMVSEAGINNLSLGSNFYLAGAVRYYFNGDLTTNKRLNALFPNQKDTFKRTVCEKLNNVILVLRNKYIDAVGVKMAQPEDFGTLSIDKLFAKYDPRKPKEAEPVEQKINKEGNASKGWTYDICLSLNETSKYKEFTSPGAWCITYGKQYLSNYTRMNNSHFVIIRRDGWENVPRCVGKGFPLDDYGTSLMAIQMRNSDGMVVAGTSRWNHGSTDTPRLEVNADTVVPDNAALKKITGIGENTLQKIQNEYLKLKETKKSVTREDKTDMLRRFKYAQMLINNGQNYSNIFDFDKLLYGNGKVMKSVFCVALNDPANGLSDVCLMANGKILYNSTMISGVEERELFYQRGIWDEYSNNMPGILSAKKRGSRELLFFDAVAKKRVIADGKGFFNEGYTKYSDLLELVLGKRRAFYNLNTREVITTPHGDQSFDEWTIVAPSILKLVVNREMAYIYDMRKNNFVSLVEDRTLNYKAAGIYNIVAIDNNNFMCVCSNGGILRVYDVNTMKPIEIDGRDSFSSMQKLAEHSRPSNIVLLNPKGENFQSVYDLSTRQKITFNFRDTDGFEMNEDKFKQSYWETYGWFPLKGANSDMWIVYNSGNNELIKMGDTYRFKAYHGVGYADRKSMMDEKKYKCLYGDLERELISITPYNASIYGCFFHIDDVNGDEKYVITPYGLDYLERLRKHHGSLW